jgi:hypothetical protein
VIAARLRVFGLDVHAVEICGDRGFHGRASIRIERVPARPVNAFVMPRSGAKAPIDRWRVTCSPA